jgi:hypothetical protein
VAGSTRNDHSGLEREKGGGNNVKSILVLLLLAILFLIFSCPTTGQSQAALTGKSAQAHIPIPDQFHPLYQELDETLRQANQKYPFDKAASRPLVAPYLFISTDVFKSTTSNSKPWQDLLATLDAFKAMRIDGVSVMIAAPFLTVGEPKSLIDIYQRLAGEIHSRNMKLYVEHFVSPPFGPYALKGLHNDPQGKKEFLEMMEKEVSLIYREIRPDYLSLVTEPETLLRWTHLSFSADEWAAWIREVTTHLKSTKASPNTLLGAGAGTWESDEFVQKFAQQTNLDYVDIHLYALRLNGEDQVAKLAMLMRKVREVRPDMRVTIGESWLYKHGAAEPKGMLNREAFARDNFSFWAPLDEEFLKLLLGMAQKEKIAVVVPYFSQYFFTYYTFGDTESSQLPPWPDSVPVSWNKALESIRNHQLSSTGRAMRTMLDGDRK